MRKIFLAVLAAVCVLQAMALEESVELKGVGKITLRCYDSNGWRFEMKGHAEGDRGIVSIDLDNDKPTAAFQCGFQPSAWRCKLSLACGR